MLSLLLNTQITNSIDKTLSNFLSLRTDFHKQKYIYINSPVIEFVDAEGVVIA